MLTCARRRCRSATLIIIDAQNEYLDGKLALPGAKPAMEALARLLAKARAAGAPVVHVEHKGRAGRAVRSSRGAAAPSSRR